MIAYFSIIVNAAVGTNEVWIGANDFQQEGNFTWLDGGNVTDENIGWAAGDPNNVGGIEDCALLNWTLAPYNSVVDIRCQHIAYSLCEKKLF